ncbi:MAG: bifunctional transaldolase/phosoglucose isomerase [Alphaproteobacteria bacterium]|nr:bifunctional transaldolase/phosoglucose isomerase [Alphaproteobacteria bacterium]
MNPVKQLEQHGQAVWLDYLARSFVAGGDLKKRIESDGIRGVTSNPAIFEKAIAASDDYDPAIATALVRADQGVSELYESLAVEDIQKAAEVLRPLYDACDGQDGFVSLEVSPYLAEDSAATLLEARRLWTSVQRCNLMIKIPATAAGVPAITQLISEGVNINVTLLFSRSVYREVADAYIAGLEQYVAGGGDPSRVASVASFFVSRIDSAVDDQLDAAIARSGDAATRGHLAALKGKAAIANARLAYQDYKELFSGPRWEKLQARGARPQRMLWASTGTKNKNYSDVLYVEELIGANTINTIPPATMDAFRDHGRLRASLEDDLDGARNTLENIARAGISLEAITAGLLKDGVQLFADAADRLLGAVAARRSFLLGGAINQQQVALPPGLAADLARETEEWRARGRLSAIYRRDSRVWSGADEDRWLGWLDCVTRADIAAYASTAREIRGGGFSDVVVLGMGGSSLGPEVIAMTYPPKPGFPRLHVLDSTDPAQVRAMESRITLATTLFIVSSKSGGTTEPNAMKDYFLDRVSAVLGPRQAGLHFIAITDPGSSLEAVAGKLGFGRIFHGEPAIGGRYSVLSPFGLVPAAASGVDIGDFVGHTMTMMRSCAADVPPEQNPAVQLGLAMGLAGLAGRDKVTLLCSPKISDFGAWAEQLIAESTGKEGKGLIPIDGEDIGAPRVYGADRFFIQMRTRDEADPALEEALAAIEAAGHPVVRIIMTSVDQLGQEFFRFELATAVAGAVLGINPFDQPDVESAKIRTRELTAAFEKTGALPPEQPVLVDGDIALYCDAANAAALRDNGAGTDLASWLSAHFRRCQSGDYIALLAYIIRNDATIGALQKIRLDLRDHSGLATCAQFGPRFLHSTGQAYKGGPNSGVFLQITAEEQEDLAVPGAKASFGIIKAAQARGDFDVLSERRRRALRVHLRGDLTTALATLHRAITGKS